MHGDVRIVDGSSTSNGRVEVFVSSQQDGPLQWSTICDDDWDIRDADVVCRQLGYPRSLAAARGNTFPMGSGSILRTGVQCVGNETSLLNCPAQTNNISCNHMEDAGVYCFGGLKISNSFEFLLFLIRINYCSYFSGGRRVGYDTVQE